MSLVPGHAASCSHVIMQIELYPVDTRETEEKGQNWVCKNHRNGCRVIEVMQYKEKNLGNLAFDFGSDTNWLNHCDIPFGFLKCLYSSIKLSVM